MATASLLPNALTAEQEEQAARDLRHAERDRQLASMAAHFAEHPDKQAQIMREVRALRLRQLNRLNAEANHDYVEGFEEHWDDSHASTKRGL